MNYVVLKAEIALPAYAGMTDQQIADALNAATIAARQDVAGEEIRDVLRGAAVYGRYVVASRLQPTGTLVAPSDQDLAVGRIIELLAAADYGIRLSRAGVRTRFLALLDAMVTDGTMTAGLRTALQAPMTISISRATQLGLPPVDDQAVITARRS